MLDVSLVFERASTKYGEILSLHGCRFTTALPYFELLLASSFQHNNTNTNNNEMYLSTRGTVLDNRRFLWTASITFALAAIVFPLVVLAAFGHFSSSNQTPQEAANSSLEVSGLVPASTPSQPPPPSSNGFIDPRDVGITTPEMTPAPYSLNSRPGGDAVDAELWLPPSSSLPTVTESMMPSLFPSMQPSQLPSELPSLLPSSEPSALPSHSPTNRPTQSTTAYPSVSPTEPPILVTYRPGFLTVTENGLLLSAGLQARLIAQTGKFVSYRNGKQSSDRFHVDPDFGATFPDPSPWNPGGWIYTSNAEAKTRGEGGVGAITFDRNGNVLNYKMVLRGTTMNCGGGRSPWGTWISCEEWGTRGQVFQVDPTGNRPSEKTVLGGSGGQFESFAYDVRDKSRPRFFVTEDHARGTLRRFTPVSPDWNNPWTMLHGNGTMEYLVLEPTSLQQGLGRFQWVSSIETGRANAQRYYPLSEGIDVSGDTLYFVCKKIKQLFTLNLDTMTYTNRTTLSGLFDGGPDQMSRIIGHDGRDILYFTEEGGRDAGIHGRDSAGNFYTILESPQYIDEATGLSFDPSGRHMYVAYQRNGLLFDITRQDGLPFYGTTLNVKYHNQN